jgi:hypothetical protein
VTFFTDRDFRLTRIASERMMRQRRKTHSFSNTQVKHMTTLLLLQACKYKRHGSIAVMPACSWANSVVSGST